MSGRQSNSGFFRDNAHAARSGPSERARDSATVLASFLLYLLDLFEPKDVLCEIIGLDLLRQRGLEVGITNQEA